LGVDSDPDLKNLDGPDEESSAGSIDVTHATVAAHKKCQRSDVAKDSSSFTPDQTGGESMTTKSICVSFLAAVFFVSAVRAEEPLENRIRFRGAAGDVTCEAWTTGRQAAWESWVLGYLTGFASGTDKPGHGLAKSMMTGPSDANILQRVDRMCRESPWMRLNLAVTFLAADLAYQADVTTLAKADEGE